MELATLMACQKLIGSLDLPMYKLSNRSSHYEVSASPAEQFRHYWMLQMLVKFQNLF